jgi:TPR repeat protein
LTKFLNSSSSSSDGDGFLNIRIASAAYQLGRCYYDGFGVSVDYEQAFSLFQRSLTHNPSPNYNTHHFLALCYSEGKGTQKNLNQALEHAKICLESSDSPSVTSPFTLQVLKAQIQAQIARR